VLCAVELKGRQRPRVHQNDDAISKAGSASQRLPFESAFPSFEPDVVRAWSRPNRLERPSRRKSG
jgi:hypothetical protein